MIFTAQSILKNYECLIHFASSHFLIRIQIIKYEDLEEKKTSVALFI